MEQLVDYIARSLVDSPEDVKISSHEEEDTVTIELSVAKEDLGKIIGKQGRTARAMRTLLSATGEKEKKKIRLEILE